MSDKKKLYCYVDNCGEKEAVETGFHLEKYMVCRLCKEEITNNLATLVNERHAKKKENKEMTSPNKINSGIPGDEDYVLDIWSATVLNGGTFDDH